MSNALALLKGRHVELAESAYFERADQTEQALEAYLRQAIGVVTRRLSVRRRMRRFTAEVNAQAQTFKALTDPELVARFAQVSSRMQRTGLADKETVESFALVREASARILGMRHHDVQIMAGWALLQGYIAEMATGEGKTLVASLPATVAAGAGAAVHVVTVNDYLAERDAGVNTPLFQFFGLSIGCIRQGMSPEERRDIYRCDIVYASNKEIVFDYLKDRIAFRDVQTEAHQRLQRLYRSQTPPSALMRGLHLAIVDEADSVLIDEARTPLIISETEQNEDSDVVYRQAIEMAGQLVKGADFEISPDREVTVTRPGFGRVMALARELTGVWQSARWQRELIQQALSALWCFHRDQHYIVVEDKVQIVDEFTGRTMPDRSWERGLHQMIEAKEGCEISGQRKTLARITYQRFFSRYLLLCGMTGTAAEIAGELWNVYKLKVVPIPTHKPPRRRFLGGQCTLDPASHARLVAERARGWQAQGRPVLIGTRSVEASESLGRVFTEFGVDHAVLNARQDRAEADVIAEAGQPGRVTIATNMAGRGTDIRLGEGVSALGGLHVILTEYHESARIDRQLFGRSARQGEPGSVEAIVCFDDELFKRFAPRLQRVCRSLAALRGGQVSPVALHWLVRFAQHTAETQNARVRMENLKQDRKLQSMLAFSGRAD